MTKRTKRSVEALKIEAKDYFVWDSQITADQARKLAQEVMGSTATGDNPAEEINLHRRALTVAALCDRFFRSTCF